MGFNIDGETANADWPKAGTWDFQGTPDQQAQQILMAGGPNQRKNLQRFLELPAARLMPDNVREAIRARGYRI